MIQKFYGLEQDAFSLSPDLEFLYLSRSHEEAVAHLAYGLEQNEDIILICGDIGTGKTLALHRLVEQISTAFVPVLITVTTLDFEQLLRLVLMKMGVEVGGASGTAELVYAFEKALIEMRGRGKKVLLIIDEGQNLPLESLESVRLLMNLGQPGGQALQLVLAGQLGLRANLELPQMRQLHQRIRVDYLLDFLSRDELEGYVNHRLEVAGRKEPLFKKDALDKIHRLSKGVPRVVNHLASKALLSGYIEEARQISAKHVEELAPGAPHEDEPPAVTRTVHPDQPPVPIVEDPQVGLDADDVAVLVDNLAETVRREEARAVAPAGPPPPPTRQPVAPPPPPPANHQEPGDTPGEYGGAKRSRRGWWLAGALLVLVAVGYFTYPDWRGRLRSLLPAPAESQGPAAVKAGPAATVVPTAEVPADTPPDSREAPADSQHSILADPVGTGEYTDPENQPVREAEKPDPVPTTTATTTSTSPTADPVADDLEDSWLIHVASFRTLDRAINLTRRFQSEGLQAEYRTLENDKGEMWHRVYLGPYFDRVEAHRVALTLKEDGLIKFSRITQYVPPTP